MDLDLAPPERAFRAEVRTWLRANLPDDLRAKVARYAPLCRDDLARWHRILAAQGWIAPAWPTEWGGTGWDATQRYLFEEECG
jgi:alkylation response protein AidB-like acyl-CoA dehydrogenase